MNHSDTSALLCELFLAAHEQSERLELLAHLEQCPDCQAQAVLNDHLSGRTEHPSSELLASYSLVPGRLSEDQRRLCSDHLAECSDCANQSRLVSEAVVEARTDAAEGAAPAAPLWARSGGPVVRLALAATLVLTAIAWLLPTLLPQSGEKTPVSGVVLRGERTVASSRALVVNDTVVSSGATVVLEGGDSVAFGNGFSVNSGARLTVANPPLDHDDSASS